jgi:hypothetical protein
MPAEHIKAQNFSPVARFSKAHFGTASQPEGLSLGQAPTALQWAVHSPPRTPCTLIGTLIKLIYIRLVYQATKHKRLFQIIEP